MKFESKHNTFQQIKSGTYNTQELLYGIRLAANPWPVKISYPLADHKVGLAATEALKGQGVCHKFPWYLIFPCSAFCMPHDCG